MARGGHGGVRRVGALAAVTLFAGVLMGSGPSWACACGAMFAEDAISVADESAVVRVGDATQTVVLGLGVESVSQEAALVLPTPAPADVDLADPAVFDDLARISRPDITYTRDWWPDRWFAFGYGAGGGQDGGVEVLGETTLGSFDVATLAADDPGALTGWLDENGYALDPAVERALEPYVEEGWYYVAVKLRSEAESLDGALEPIRVEFAADEPVYPMRLSAAAEHAQSVRVYTLADHRMERVDAAADAVPAELAFAGRVHPGEVESPATADLIGDDGAFLTTFDHDIADPSAITSDFRFAPAAEDTEERRVETVSQPYYIGGIAAGPLVVGLSVLAAAALAAGAAWYRRRRGDAS